MADADTQVTLTIEESDDPYGRFAFNFNSTELTIAEDYYPGEENITVGTFVVERRQGAFGNVQVGNCTGDRYILGGISKCLHQFHPWDGNMAVC